MWVVFDEQSDYLGPGASFPHPDRVFVDALCFRIKHQKKHYIPYQSPVQRKSSRGGFVGALKGIWNVCFGNPPLDKSKEKCGQKNKLQTTKINQRKT